MQPTRTPVTADVARVISALRQAEMPGRSSVDVEAVAAVIAADSLVFALRCQLEDLAGLSGAAGLAVEQIAHAISGRGVIEGLCPDRCPKFNASFAEFAEIAAQRVTEWGFSPVEVLLLSAQMLYSAEALFHVSDLAASLEAAAI